MKKIFLIGVLLFSSSSVLAETTFSFSIGSPIIEERRYYNSPYVYGYPPLQPYYYSQPGYYYTERDRYNPPVIIYRNPPTVYQYGDKLHRDNGRGSRHYNFNRGQK